MSRANNQSFISQRVQNRPIVPMANWVCWLVGALMLASLLSARADEEEDQYFVVLGMIQKADALYSSGQTAKALATYQQAAKSLLDFHKRYLDWNPKVIAYRVKYVADKIALCSDKLAPAPPPKTRAPSNDQAGVDSGSNSAEPASGVKIKLLESGNEPRKVLRLHPKAGDKQTLIMTLKMGMGIKMGEPENPPIKLPAINMTMQATVNGVSPEGDISSEFVMTDASLAEEPGVLPQVAETMKTSLENFKNLSGKGVTTDRGVSKSMEFNAPNATDPQVRQAVEQMKDSFGNVSTPLPEEAVGEGAKWEVYIPLKSQGMNIGQTTTYELVALKDDDLNIKLTVVQTAPKQKIQNPAMPAVKLDLLKMAGSGSGEVNLNLGRILPSGSALKSHADIEMGVGTGAQQQTMTMKMDVDLHLESK